MVNVDDVLNEHAMFLVLVNRFWKIATKWARIVRKSL